QNGDLTAVLLLEEQRLLDGVLVELVDDAVGRFSVERLVFGVELPFGRRVRDLLDQNDNIHGRWPTSLHSHDPPYGGADADAPRPANNVECCSNTRRRVRCFASTAAPRYALPQMLLAGSLKAKP